MVAQLAEVRRVHELDLAAGRGRVYLPDALARKFPAADREYKWQYVFPSGKLSFDPRGGEERRHHAHEGSLGRAVTEAVRAAGYSGPHLRDQKPAILSYPFAGSSDRPA
ncbi:MAG TPA: hypothetical protein VH092_32340, partial [Urbifossiella sp.]|nr:hypothetical protein [Urbifossiella sp.]